MDAPDSFSLTEEPRFAKYSLSLPMHLFVERRVSSLYHHNVKIHYTIFMQFPQYLLSFSRYQRPKSLNRVFAKLSNYATLPQIFDVSF